MQAWKRNDAFDDLLICNLDFFYCCLKIPCFLNVKFVTQLNSTNYFNENCYDVFSN